MVQKVHLIVTEPFCCISTEMHLPYRTCTTGNMIRAFFLKTLPVHVYDQGQW